MDIRTELQKLPPPDPTAPDRVWKRFQESRRRPSRSRWVVPMVGLTLVAAAGLLTVATGVFSDAPRTLAFDEGAADVESVWSDVVTLDVDGRGTARGTDRDLEIAWESGTLVAHVTPNTGTQLAVTTEEARVEVVGTVFSVTRDRLGVTTAVQKGKVRVECKDGWTGFVTPDDAPRTCLPVRAALLLSRADTLADSGADAAVQLDTLDRGIEVAEPGSVVHGELLVRRMRVHGDAGRIDAALADATAYLDTPDPSRALEVHHYAGWKAMAAKGCDAALSHLAALEGRGSPEDRILLAECLMDRSPERARDLLDAALDEDLEPSWVERARRDRDALEGR